MESIEKIETNDEEKRIAIAIVGETGAGKSYFGNQLIGDFNAFKSSSSLESCTKHVTKYQAANKNNFMVIDTPGFFDNSANA